MRLLHAGEQMYIGKGAPATCREILDDKTRTQLFLTRDRITRTEHTLTLRPVGAYFPFGFHSCASFCASAIWAGVI